LVTDSHNSSDGEFRAFPGELQAMAAAGVDSRRKCEALVLEGHVKVNGNVVTEPGTIVDLSKDSLRVFNRVIRASQQKLYFMLNKPKGYICSVSPQEGLASKPVLSIFEPYFKKCLHGQPVGTKPPRLFTVGRLDVNTTGLLLVTSDGTWAQRIAHPAAGMRPLLLAHDCVTYTRS
jgi:16S rRNA U516 pseudouridylate synthase RsuA-like enzyme